MSRFWEDLTFRGLVHQVTDASLEEKLEGERITLYAGFDPTADSLHVGHLLGVLTLRRFQQAGHRPIALAGGGTGMVGDPGGRSEERNLLSRDELEHNLASIRGQLSRFLDFDQKSEGGSALLLDNGQWLWELGLLEFLRDTAKHFTVNQMIAKESVRSRLEGREQGISFTEFSYMLLQAQDFLHLHDNYGCRLQIGGSDQWGNITAGVDLIRRKRAVEVWGLTTPLVLKADGTKFGKSASGTVWLDARRTSPYALYQFMLQSEDSVVGRYLRYFTWLEREEIVALDQATADTPGLRRAQRALASEVVAVVHGRDAAAAAESASRALFGGDLRALDEPALKEVLAEAPSSCHPYSRLQGEGWDLLQALVSAGLCGSLGEGRRAVAQGGVAINGARVDRTDRSIREDDLLWGRYVALRKGKHSWHLLQFGG
ncbi:MAG: tyrosine--tRNA ligase [Actinomycetota bacterium]|nr:tyrosine--tRNA ligase [Actinomycetota bacterium]